MKVEKTNEWKKKIYTFVVLAIIIIVGIYISVKIIIPKYEEKAVRDYELTHSVNWDYEIKKSYESKKDLYIAIIDLAKYEDKKVRELGEAYNINESPGKLGIYFGGTTELEKYLANKMLNLNNVYDAFSESYYRLELQCAQESDRCLWGMLGASNFNENLDVENIYNELKGNVRDIAIIDRIRVSEGDKDLFISCDTDVKMDIFDTLYHSGMVNGAMEILKDTLYKPGSEEILRAYTYINEKGYYDFYAEEIEKAKRRRNEVYREETECNDAEKYTYQPSDPYSVYDYSHPEDFYEDYYDDFYDYEEAEDYYNEYWEK